MPHLYIAPRFFQSNLTGQTLHKVMKERRSTTTLLTWWLWHHVFHPCQTGALENIAHPCLITMTHHPSYFVYWLTFVTWNWFPGSSYFLVYIEKIGSLGTRIRLIADKKHQYSHKFTLRIAKTSPACFFSLLSTKALGLNNPETCSQTSREASFGHDGLKMRLSMHQICGQCFSYLFVIVPTWFLKIPLMRFRLTAVA